MILIGNCIEVLRGISGVQMCVTSPPYWGLRDYGVEGQLGLEETPEEYVQKMVEVFRLVRDCLKDDGTLWLNLGDSYYNYRPGSEAQSKQTICGHDGAIVTESAKRGNRQAGLKEKDLVGIPWRVAFALQADGWYLRQDIIWAKPNPMPESVRDRCTKSHEYLFLLSKSQRYYYDADAIAEPFADERMGNPGVPSPKAGNIPGQSAHTIASKVWDKGQERAGRNKRSVWTVPTSPYAEAHFATYPPALIEPCILAGSRPGDIVLDPFFGSGTTGEVCNRLGREWIGIELNPEYAKLAEKRVGVAQYLLL